MNWIIPLLAEQRDALCELGNGWPTITIADPRNPDTALTIPNLNSELYDDLGSLEDYVRGNCAFSAMTFLRDLIENKKIKIDRYVPEVAFPESYFLDSAQIEKVEFAALDQTSVRCDIIFSTQITVLGKVYFHQDGYPWHPVLGSDPLPVRGKATQWFRVTGRISFQQYTLHTIYQSASVYRSRDRALWQLDESLVPYICQSEGYESYAYHLLQQYQPESLSNAQPLDLTALIQQFNLKVQDANLSDDCRVMGRLIFKSVPGIYNNEDYQSIIEVDQKTNRTERDRRATIVHEILHYIKDRYFLIAQNIYRQQVSIFSCEKGNIAYSYGNSLYWAEYQVRELVRRVMMPFEQALFKADEFLQLLKAGDTPTPDQLEKTTRALAVFFKVPIRQAKLRMTDLGFNMNGILTYVDNELIPAYYSSATISKGESYNISQKQLLDHFIENEEFRQWILTGKYCYVEGHVCLNLPSYVAMDTSGHPILTVYARNHIDECCILFSFDCRDEKFLYTEGQMYRRTGSTSCATSANVPFGIEDAEVLSAELDFRMNVFPSLPSGYTQCFKAHLKRLKVTQENAGFESGLSRDTVRRLIQGVNRSLKKLLIVLLSVNMECCSIVDLVQKGHYGFDIGDRFHAACSMLLNLSFRTSLTDFNANLVKLGFKPLSNTESEQDT